LAALVLLTFEGVLSAIFAFVAIAAGFFVILLLADLLADALVVAALFRGLIAFAGVAFAFSGAASFIVLAAGFAVLAIGLVGTFDVALTTVFAAGLTLAFVDTLADFFVAVVLVVLFVTTDVSFFAGFFIALAIESNQPKLKSYLKFKKIKHCYQSTLRNRTIIQKSNSTFLSIGVLGYSEEHMLT
jgi:hypothetical protein